MKKLILVLVVVAMLIGVGGNAFAVNLPGVAPEGSNPKNAVHADLSWLFSGLISGGFGIGAGYERAVLPYLSIKATGGFIFWPYGSSISILGGVRGYFLKGAVNGPFAGVSAGVNIASFSYGGYGASGVGFSMLIEGGYKFTVMNGGQGGFFVEPVIGALLGFGAGGVGAGFHWGANIGWSF